MLLFCPSSSKNSSIAVSFNPRSKSKFSQVVVGDQSPSLKSIISGSPNLADSFALVTVPSKKSLSALASSVSLKTIPWVQSVSKLEVSPESIPKITFEGALEQLKSTSISSLKLTSKFISSGKSGTASSSVVSDSLSLTSAYIDPNSLFDLTLIFPIMGASSSSNSPKNIEASKSKSFGSSSILSNILLFEKLSTSINKLCIASLLNSSKLTSI